MSTSRPADVCVTNNFYQGPIPEDYDRPILEDCYRKGEERCDSQLESEDDGWPGTENHWCPLLELSYHDVIGPLLTGFMGRTDSTSTSATCQLAIFIAPVDRDTAMRRVCGEIKCDDFGWMNGVMYHHSSHNKVDTGTVCQDQTFYSNDDSHCWEVSNDCEQWSTLCPKTICASKSDIHNQG